MKTFLSFLFLFVFSNALNVIENSFLITDAAPGFFDLIIEGSSFGRAIHVQAVPDGFQLTIGIPNGSPPGLIRAGSLLTVYLDSNGVFNSAQTIINTGDPLAGQLNPEDFLGTSVTTIGDLNGDGFPELLAGAPGDDPTTAQPDITMGAVYVIFTNSTGLIDQAVQILNPFANNPFQALNFGASVAALPDFTTDGRTTVVVGDPFFNFFQSGAIFILFLNPDGTLDDIQQISGTSGNLNATVDISFGDQFGISVDSLGDLNGDGIPEVVVGAPGDDDGPNDSGAIYILFLNADATVNSSQKISDLEGNFNGVLSGGDQFGFSVSANGDFNGDEIPDVVVGAPSDDDGGSDRGAIYILFLNADATVNSFQKISDSQGQLNLDNADNFGSSIFAMPSTSSLWVGAIGDDGDQNLSQEAGAIYFFQVNLCGDGIVVPGQACDDGNFISGDGCSNACEVEFGFDCDTSISPSLCQPICGDGAIIGNEECDDSNVLSNDGCSASCQIEAGFSCNVCEPLCGDGMIAGDEECDDANLQSGDGCSSLCSSESNSLSSGAIGGIVVGVVIFLCIVILISAAIGFFILSKIKNKKRTLDLSMLGDNIPILTNIQIGKVIGSGAFGEVYQARWNNIDVALKSTKGEDVQEFENELQIMLEMRHPNILQLFGLFVKVEDQQPMIVTEFMNQGDLLHLLQTEAEITNKQLVEFCQQISLGMEYLHSRDILHRDLACRNILVSSKTLEDTSNLTVKVADFGLSRHTPDYYKIQSKKIPVRWTAPEVIEFGKALKPSDVWSYGIVVWEIFSRGAIPYAGFNNQQVIEFLKSGRRIDPPPTMPGPISDILKECWKRKPGERPPFSSISKNFSTLEIPKQMPLPRLSEVSESLDDLNQKPQGYFEADAPNQPAKDYANPDISPYTEAPRIEQQPNTHTSKTEPVVPLDSTHNSHSSESERHPRVSTYIDTSLPDPDPTPLQVESKPSHEGGMLLDPRKPSIYIDTSDLSDALTPKHLSQDSSSVSELQNQILNLNNQNTKLMLNFQKLRKESQTQIEKLEEEIQRLRQPKE